jgi:hypothetical protein
MHLNLSLTLKKILYSPLEINEEEYFDKVGFPGEYPLTQKSDYNIKERTLDFTAIENDFVQKEIQIAAYNFEKDIESGDNIIVGLSKFKIEDDIKTGPIKN